MIAKNNIGKKCPTNRSDTPKRYNYPNFSPKRFCRAFAAFCRAVALGNEDAVFCNEAENDVFELDGGVFDNDRKTGKYLISPLGDFPNGAAIQRVDIQAAQEMKSNLRSFWSKATNIFGNACPVYYTHPETIDRDGSYPCSDKTPYGKVTDIEILSNGIWANIEWLDGFDSLPKGLRFSPRWKAARISNTVFRPHTLLSLGLVKRPNIAGVDFANEKQKEKEMINEILKLLGFTLEQIEKFKTDESAITLADVEQKIGALKGATEAAKTAGEAEKAALQAEIENQKNACAKAQECFKNERAARAKLVVESCVNSGKLTVADAPAAQTALEQSGEFEVLANSYVSRPATLKTGSQISDAAAAAARVSQTKGDDAKVEEFMNEVRAWQKKGLAYDDAWNAARLAKPALKKEAFGE